MMSRQHTIRAVPDSIDRALRRRAKQEAKSINAVTVEALARGLELDARPPEHSDLDFLIGSWQEDPAFDRALASSTGGLIEIVFQRAFRHDIPHIILASSLHWWRFYTFYLYILLGAVAAGATVLRALRRHEGDKPSVIRHTAEISA